MVPFGQKRPRKKRALEKQMKILKRKASSVKGDDWKLRKENFDVKILQTHSRSIKNLVYNSRSQNFSRKLNQNILKCFMLVSFNFLYLDDAHLV